MSKTEQKLTFEECVDKIKGLYHSYVLSEDYRLIPIITELDEAIENYSLVLEKVFNNSEDIMIEMDQVNMELGNAFETQGFVYGFLYAAMCLPALYRNPFEVIRDLNSEKGISNTKN